VNEWWHLPSGLCHLQFGRFEPYRVNPPLVRTLAALPVWWLGGGVDEFLFSDFPGARPERELGIKYLEQHGEKCITFFRIARLISMVFAIIGTVLIWFLANHWYGNNAAKIASILWVFSPSVLSTGAMITPDCATTVSGLLAIVTYWRWVVQPTWERLWVSSIALSVAMLCKTTWIFLPAIFLGVFCLAVVFKIRKFSFRKEFAQAFVGVCCVILGLNAGYNFQSVGIPLGDYTFVSQDFIGHQPSDLTFKRSTGNQFNGTILGMLRLPIPKDYLLGIDIQRMDFEEASDAYLFGHWKKGGWWYYYLVGLILKEPISLWVLGLLAFRKSWKGRTNYIKLEQLVIFLPGIFVFILASSQTNLNHHLRYVLPILPVVFLFIATLGVNSDVRIHWVVKFLLLCYAISSASVLPRSYAFFSEIVGGPYNGWRYLSNSNLDWGQDLLTVRDWIATQQDSPRRFLLYSDVAIDVRLLGVNTEPGIRFMSILDSGTYRPSVPGQWIVFSSFLASRQGSWFQTQTPTHILSPTVRVFSVSESQIQ